MMKFPALWICGFLLLAGGKGANAWGGVFNRFSPEMLSNMGYGSHGGSSYRPQPLFQVSTNLDFFQPDKSFTCQTKAQRLEKTRQSNFAALKLQFNNENLLISF